MDPRGSIHVYNHDIQRSLKPLIQPKPNGYEEGSNIFINKPGHVTKMAAIAIYGKNP